MKEYRPHRWLDTDAMSEKWGIQRKHDGKWCHLHSNGAPLIFDTKSECVEKIATLRAQD